MTTYTTVEDQVEFGLENIDASRTIEVNLRDFLYLHNSLAEFVRFFHQPMHFSSMEDINVFLGNRDNGALHLLWECVYKKFEYSNVFPKDVVEMIDNSVFENPNPPYYFKP